MNINMLKQYIYVQRYMVINKSILNIFIFFIKKNKNYTKFVGNLYLSNTKIKHQNDRRQYRNAKGVAVEFVTHMTWSLHSICSENHLISLREYYTQTIFIPPDYIKGL